VWAKGIKLRKALRHKGKAKATNNFNNTEEFDISVLLFPKIIQFEFKVTSNNTTEVCITFPIF
jgi:hypothetical protein